MSDWHNKIDVTYSVYVLFFLSNFNTTTVTNDSFVSDSFVFSTSTFKIFTGPKIFTERPSRSGLCTVVDRLWLQTSPLDSFKIDSGEASPIDILLNLFTGFLSIIIPIIHHSSYY
jgi:hypothetical protein